MKATIVSAILSAFAFCIPAISYGTVIDPTSDGSLYACSGCNVVQDGAYVLTSGYIQGDVKFSSASISGTITQALLSLNPYGLPLFGTNVDVYGYGTTIGSLDVSDANAGAFLGTLVLPQNLGYGQDAYFDVTSFVDSVNAPFIAFNLRSTGTDVFSSLEYNYGQPSQLLVTTVPEPAPIGLFSAGLLAVAFMFRNRKTYRR